MTEIVVDGIPIWGFFFSVSFPSISKESEAKIKKCNRIIGIITIGLVGIVSIIVEPAFALFSVGFSGIFIAILVLEE